MLTHGGLAKPGEHVFARPLTTTTPAEETAEKLVNPRPHGRGSSAVSMPGRALAVRPGVRRLAVWKIDADFSPIIPSASAQARRDVKRAGSGRRGAQSVRCLIVHALRGGTRTAGSCGRRRTRYRKPEHPATS